MAQFNIPHGRGQLSGLGDKMLAGLTALGVTLGITQITAAAFGALLSAFKAAYSNYNSARSSERAAYNLFHSKEKAIVDWLGVVRGILIGDFGNRWNTMWAQCGFTQPSTAIPQRIQDRIALVQNIGAFLTANPSYEVADRSVTAEQATTLYNDIQAAQAPLQTAQTTLKTKSEALATAQTALEKSMRDVIKILKATLAGDDPRWHSFGLPMPSTPTTPGKPQNVTATLTADGTLIVQCDATPLATRYRGRMLIVGVDTKYRLAFSGKEPMGTIQGLQPGVTVQIIMQAVNEGSQGVASDPIFFTMPEAQAAEEIPTPAAEVSPLTAIASNGNAAGNGKANGNGAGLPLSHRS